MRQTLSHCSRYPCAHVGGKQRDPVLPEETSQCSPSAELQHSRLARPQLPLRKRITTPPDSRLPPITRCVPNPNWSKRPILRQAPLRKLDCLDDLMLTSWTVHTFPDHNLACPEKCGRGPFADKDHSRGASSTKGTIKNRQGNFSLRCHLSLPTKHARGSSTDNGGRYRDFARNSSWIC
jgi:hypothetical protein